MKKERGAAAVEMALVLPVLVLLLLGILEFGRAYNTQILMTNAAREGARVMAISKDPALARSAVTDTATTLNPKLVASNIAIAAVGQTTTNLCPSGSTATVTISYQLTSMTRIAGPFPMTGKAAMLCGG